MIAKCTLSPLITTSGANLNVRKATNPNQAFVRTSLQPSGDGVLMVTGCVSEVETKKTKRHALSARHNVIATNRFPSPLPRSRKSNTKVHQTLHPPRKTPLDGQCE